MKKRTRIIAILMAALCMTQLVPQTLLAQELDSSMVESLDNAETEELENTEAVEESTETTSNQNLTLEDANAVDETDDDNDGLINYWEEQMGTDSQNPDTDGDGLTDYEEIVLLGSVTDPCLIDTDGNGISDVDEDADGDGLSNLYELRSDYDLDPTKADTDEDGLSDYEEIMVYGTDPTKSDTDGDGASDYFEVKNGFDPLSADESFQMTLTSEDGNCKFTFTATGSVAETVTLERAESYTEQESLGAYSDCYEVYASGSFSQAVLSIKTEATLTDKPMIFSYADENETESMKACPTSLVNGWAKTYLTTSGKYILKTQTSHIDFSYAP